MKIITTGYKYLDIDAYAGCVAYAEFWQKQGIEAAAVCSGTINQSVPSIIQAWPVELKTSYTPIDEDTFTLIDISEPDYFEKFVNHGQIDEVIDHHAGFEEYWQKRIGSGAIIEHVGAACTLVFEKWEKAEMLAKMSETSARLLMCGILDNTLNFGADITTNRDRHAYEELRKIANLPGNWPKQYFKACQQEIVEDLAQAIKDDLKVFSRFKTYAHAVAAGQLAVWDGKELAHESFEVFKETHRAQEPRWFMNLISLNDKKSYFVTDLPEVKEWLSSLLNIEFVGNIAAADRMWLRKEIKRADIAHEK